MKKLSIALIALAYILFTYAVYLFNPIGVDWRGGFRPAALALASGQSPYQRGVFNPPWLFPVLVPFALLPERVGVALMFTAGVFGFALAAWRFGGRPWQVALMALSPYTLLNSINGNVDFLIAIGCTLTPQAGLFLVLLKPQLGAGVAVFWLIEAWRVGGPREVVRVFAPVGLAFVAAYLVYGPFWSSTMDLAGSWWNASIWPNGIMIGLALIVSAIRGRKIGSAIAASPFLSPYLSGHGWAIAIFGTIRDPAVFAAVWIGSWIVGLIK